VYVAEDWPLVLAPTPAASELIADENDDTANRNTDLNSIPKPKKLDSLFTPDIFDLSLKDQL
jgi:hypothetical protein